MQYGSYTLTQAHRAQAWPWAMVGLVATALAAALLGGCVPVATPPAANPPPAGDNAPQAGDGQPVPHTSAPNDPTPAEPAPDRPAPGGKRPRPTDTAQPMNQEGLGDWPVFRGDSLSTGVARSALPDELELVWRYTVDNGAFEGTPALVGGVAYLGDMDGKVYAWRLHTGETLWEKQFEAGFSASPAVRDGRLYLGDIDGVFHCLDAATGDVRWRFAAEAEVNGSANFHGPHVLFGSQDATLYVLDAQEGTEVWKYTIQDQIRCSPTVVENRVFLAGCDRKLHIVDLAERKGVAEVEIDSQTGATPAALGDLVYFGTEGGTFVAVDWRQAAIAWDYSDPDGSHPYRSSAAAAEGIVVVGGRNKRVQAFTPQGEEKWVFATRTRVDSSPVIVGDRVFVGTADGVLYALDRHNGEKRWEYEAGGGFTGSAAVAEGKLVVASERGVVYCFGKKPAATGP